MNSIIKHFLFFLAAAIIFSSCSKKYPGFEKANNGVYYQIHFQGNDSLTPKKGDWVTVLMNYGLKDTTFFKSSMLKEPLVFPMIEPMFEGDLYAGLSLMGIGDSMTFVVVADSFFYKTAMEKILPPGIQPGSPMYYDVKLLNLISNDEYIAEKEKEKDILRQKEKEILAKYIQSQKITEAPLESGLYFIPLAKGYGRVADTGEMCQIYIKVSTLAGKILYDNFNKEPMDVEFGKEFDTQGLMEGIGLLHQGEKAKLIVPSSIGVGETGWEGVAPFTTVIYEVQLLQIKSVEEVKQERAEKKRAEFEAKQLLKNAEQGKIDKYVEENSLQEFLLPSGLYFIPILEGSGNYAKQGDDVKINYALYSIDGEEIESSNKRAFEFQIGSNQVIKGWEEAIKKMKKGGRAKLVIPSKLAYGSMQMGEKIEPYTPVVSELELLEIN